MKFIIRALILHGVSEASLIWHRERLGKLFHKLTTDKLEILKAKLLRVDSFMVFAIFLIVFMATVTAIY